MSYPKTPSFRLDGKRALVTGASSGIGQGCALALGDAGAHVVYGVSGLKTHSKILLVVRRERTGIKRYAHIGTGNYYPKTARIYEDTGLFTADPDIGGEQPGESVAGVPAHDARAAAAGQGLPPRVARRPRCPLGLHLRGRPLLVPLPTCSMPSWPD